MRVTFIALLIALLASLVWQYSPRRTEPLRVRGQNRSEAVRAEASDKTKNRTDAQSERAMRAAAPELKNLQNRLAQEQVRLDSLRASLDQAKNAAAGTVVNANNENPRTREVNARVREIEEQLRMLNNRHQQNVGTSATAESGARAQSAVAAVNVEQQIQALDASLLDLQNRIGEGQEIADQIAMLKTERDRLQSQRVETRTVGEANQQIAQSDVRAEEAETEAERTRLQNELADLRREQSFWKQHAQEADPAVVQSRERQIDDLERQVSDQQAMVEKLRNRYAACVASPSDMCH